MIKNLKLEDLSYNELIDEINNLIDALEFLASDEAYQIEERDYETGYFDSYKGPQHFAETVLSELKAKR